MSKHPETGKFGYMNTDLEEEMKSILLAQETTTVGPEITYGINYSGTPITNDQDLPGLEQPFYYWIPSIAPSGMAFVNF